MQGQRDEFQVVYHTVKEPVQVVTLVREGAVNVLWSARSNDIEVQNMTANNSDWIHLEKLVCKKGRVKQVASSPTTDT